MIEEAEGETWLRNLQTTVPQICKDLDAECDHEDGYYRQRKVPGH